MMRVTTGSYKNEQSLRGMLGEYMMRVAARDAGRTVYNERFYVEGDSIM
jgi:hypothetical protein